LNSCQNAGNPAALRPGDTVLLHSNCLRTLGLLRRQGFKPSVDDVLDSFRAAIGAEGTLLLPLFNFDFTTGTPFDISRTPSHMGALTEAARLRPETVRTGHPIYSFGVMGKQASGFTRVNNVSGYGPDSPFALLRALNGKIAVLDIEGAGEYDVLSPC
jgi:aminoglycoside 3-N-acetyltransferase